MLATKINMKSFITRFLTVFFLFSACTSVQAGYVFSNQPISDTPTEQSDDLKKNKKVQQKRLKKVKEKIRKAYKKAEKRISDLKPNEEDKDNKYGTISLWTFVGSAVAGILVAFLPIVSILIVLGYLTSLITAIIGVTRDANPKRAKWMLILNLVMVVLVIISILALLLIFV